MFVDLNMINPTKLSPTGRLLRQVRADVDNAELASSSILSSYFFFKQ